MTTVIKGLEQTIEHTVNLACRVMEWDDTADAVKEDSERYTKSLWAMYRSVFLCGLSGVISQRNVNRLQTMISKGVDTIIDAETSRLLRL